MWIPSGAVTADGSDDTFAVMTGSMLSVGIVVWMLTIGSMDRDSTGEEVASIVVASSIDDVTEPVTMVDCELLPCIGITKFVFVTVTVDTAEVTNAVVVNVVMPTTLSVSPDPVAELVKSVPEAAIEIVVLTVVPLLSGPVAVLAVSVL